MFKKAFFINKAPEEFQRLTTFFVLCCLVYNLFVITKLLFVNPPQHKVSVLKDPEPVSEKTALKIYDLLDLKEVMTMDEHLKLQKDDSLYAKANHRYILDKPYSVWKPLYKGHGIVGPYYTLYDVYKKIHGLPYYTGEYRADLRTMFLGVFLVIIIPIITIVIFNYTLSPIAEKYKYFWIVPYLLNLIILVGNGIFILKIT